MKDFFPESLGQKRGCALYMAKSVNFYPARCVVCHKASVFMASYII